MDVSLTVPAEGVASGHQVSPAGCYGVRTAHRLFQDISTYWEGDKGGRSVLLVASAGSALFDREHLMSVDVFVDFCKAAYHHTVCGLWGPAATAVHAALQPAHAWPAALYTSTSCRCYAAQVTSVINFDCSVTDKPPAVTYNNGSSICCCCLLPA